MRAVTVHPLRWLGALTLAACVFGLSATVALAQGPELPDSTHYKVYRVLNPPTKFVSLTLYDQFGIRNHQTSTLDYFMAPVNKNQEGYHDSVSHYTWWRITPHPFGANVLVWNQFGADQFLKVHEPRYLLNPALKSRTGPPPPTIPLPFKNHYKCYDVDGPIPGRIVDLEDQFGRWQAYVDTAKFLCNPVEKQVPGQPPNPMVYPTLHLVCYKINPVPPRTVDFPVFVRDQFGQWQFTLVQETHLCVPSLKYGVVPTKESTWGSIKDRYR